MEKYILKAQKHCRRKISIFMMALGSTKKKYPSPLATGKQSTASIKFHLWQAQLYNNIV